MLATVTVDGHEVATVTQTRLIRAPGVTEKRLTQERDLVVGYLLSPPAEELSSPRAGVVLIGGSEGGITAWGMASLLASRGHPTLLLAYFKAPGVPRRLERIPIEHFGKALLRLAEAPGTDDNALVPRLLAWW